jgi:putative transposase
LTVGENDRKRHILVDTQGLILKLKVHEADLQDRDGAMLVLKGARKLLPRLALVWVAGADAGKLVRWAQRYLLCRLEVVRRADDVTGFKVLPKRWIVERTFGWIGRYRRSSKDYEQRLQHSEAIILLAMSHLMVRLLWRFPTFSTRS